MMPFAKKQLKFSWWLALAIAVVYALVAYFSLKLSFQGTSASPVWPDSGLAFGAVWFLGYEVWPSIWLGAFAANALVFMQEGWNILPGLPASALIATGNSVEALLGVFLLRAFVDGRLILWRMGDIFKFVFAVLYACLSSATIGISTVYFFHPSAGVAFDMAWFTWWLGDVVGVLVIAPLFLTFQKKLWRIVSWRDALEIILVSSILIIVNAGVFMGKFPGHQYYPHVTYLILPVAIWYTYRFGFMGATLSVLLTSIIAVFGAVLHLGPFTGERLPENLVILQCFMGVIAVTVLTLAAALFERQKAEENIKYNEARFRSLVENSLEVIALVDTEGKVLYTSPSTKSILGREAQELLHRSMFEWMHPDDISAVKGVFQNLLKEPGSIAHAACRLQRKDGVWRWIEGSGHNLLHDPVIEAIVINYRDVTERKMSQEHFEQVVEYSPVGKIIFNKQGDIRLVNKSTESLFGYTRHELLNMKVDSLVPQQLRGDHHPFSRQGLYYDPKATLMGAGREIFVLRKDGKQVPVQVGLTSIEMEEGFCVLVSLLDITQRKRAEEVLRRDKESLEQLVDERSKELIKTQKELKQFSRLADIGTLAATVAHELRNPLGVIHLAAYNLKKEKTELSANRHLTNIEKKVWEGNQIIDNLLSYARIKIPNYEKVRILGALDECVTSVGGRFAEKGIVIEKKYGEGLDFIEADANQIREIFVNILNNACQAFIKPGGRVLVTAGRQDEAVRVSVQDFGVGIAEEDMDKIFEPFFTRKSKGTGLGLTICNELVNLHHGKIEIDSRLGEGTTVSIILPLNRRDHAEAASH